MKNLLIGLSLTLLVLGGNAYGKSEDRLYVSDTSVEKSKAPGLSGSRKEAKAEGATDVTNSDVSSATESTRTPGKRHAPRAEKSSLKNKRGIPVRCMQEGGWQCFKDCIGNSVPPDVLLACAEMCGSGQWGSCAACLGVGVIVVIGCGAACYPLLN